jgi:hypothetical protein
VAPANGQVLVYNSSTGKWENSSAGYVPYTGAVTTVNLGAQSILAGSFVKAGGTSSQFLKADGSVDSSTYGTGTVTSVALTMPTAFSVANSPITTAGTLAVTGAGTVGQYIRGDGSLADFPATTGGGSSVSYYLNGSVSQGTIGGVAYKELNKTPIFGAGTDISINANGYIASFITDAGDPNKLLIPAGNWNFETYFSASSNGGSPSFYIELYKYNGTTFTLIASSSSAPELIAFGTNLNPYFSALAVPETVLALTDRLALRYYVTHSGRTITLHTENNHLCQVITTFTSGLTALNGLTSQVQYLTVGTSGTDFAISSATDTHTFNLPTASATNRGALSSADWTTFNNKQNALTNPVTGTGTTNYLPKFTGASTIGNSNIQDSGTLVSVGVAATFSNTLQANTTTVTNGTRSWIISPSGASIQEEFSGVVEGKIDPSSGGNSWLGATSGTTGAGAKHYFSSTGAATFAGNVTAKGILTLGESLVENGIINSPEGIFINADSDNTGGTNDIVFGKGRASTSGGTTFMTIKNGGNVGIGTASPTELLHINKSSGTGAFIRFQDTAGGGVYIGGRSENMELYAGNAEKMRITSGGNVGIGNSNPKTFAGTTLGALQVGTSWVGTFAASSTFGTILGNNVYYNSDWKRTLAQPVSFIQFNEDNFIFANAATGAADSTFTPITRMTITSDGYARLSASSGGIQFNGDTSSSNALDDYEEGSFTPTIFGSSTAGTATYSARNGLYTKIGRAVSFNIYIDWSGGTGSGNLRLSGLPFTASPTGVYPSVAIGEISNIALSANTIATARVQISTNEIWFGQAVVGGGGNSSLAYDAAGYFTLSGTYYV